MPGNVVPVPRFLYYPAAALYRLAWGLLGRLALLGGTGKAQRSLRGRLSGAAHLSAWAARQRESARPLVWFHAASVGEGRQAEAVIRPLRESRPDWQIAYTYASSSAESFAAGLPADVRAYCPADTAAATGRALDALRPAALVFSATDLWPELIRQAARRGVRLGLVSATLAPTSSRRGALARALLAPAYAALDRVGAIDQDDAAGLEALGVRPESLTVTGDTRHDAAAARAAAVDRDSPLLRALRSGPPVLVAGSTWSSDERVLLPAVAEAAGTAQLRLVIAPHEPSERHIAALERRIARNLPGAACVRLSMFETDRRTDGQTNSVSGASPAVWQSGRVAVCIVDRLGILAELYAAAAVAYVGGGFHAAGLHSVIEPAALGVPVLFGPRWSSSRDARLLLDAGGAAGAGGAGDLARLLSRWLTDPESRSAAATAALGVVEAGRGAAHRSVKLAMELVEGNANA